jgi:glycosyltransferase involved in cell wall biosynthesis
VRVLHLVKTSDGADWAAKQAGVLAQHGVDVHVAVPSPDGRTIPEWQRSGATLHIAQFDFPARAPWALPSTCSRLRALVETVRPDLIHSHFVGTTQVMRYALGARHPIPRVFQVPGPLHMEHALPRQWELGSAGPSDYWIASSDYIRRCYLSAGVPSDRVFRSYYGTRIDDLERKRRPGTRRRFGLDGDAIVVGNINYMYRPKWYLGQSKGLKGHEEVIEAIALAADRVPRLQGLLGGGAWGSDKSYEMKLRRYAEDRAPGRIVMPGALPSDDVAELWPEFDLVVHAPRSENCGGIHEAMIAGTPVLVAEVGGLPELVENGITGRSVRSRSPELLADGIVEAVTDTETTKRMAIAGAQRVRRMFDVATTGREVLDIYASVLTRHRDPNGVTA